MSALNSSGRCRFKGRKGLRTAFFTPYILFLIFPFTDLENGFLVPCVPIVSVFFGFVSGSLRDTAKPSDSVTLGGRYERIAPYKHRQQRLALTAWTRPRTRPRLP